METRYTLTTEYERLRFVGLIMPQMVRKGIKK